MVQTRQVPGKRMFIWGGGGYADLVHHYCYYQAFGLSVVKSVYT